MHVLNGGKDWLIVTPDGHFDGSDNAARYLSYRVPGTVNFVPTDSVQKRFHRPGLLAEMMGGQKP